MSLEDEIQKGAEINWSAVEKWRFVKKRALFRYCKNNFGFVEHIEFLESTDGTGAGVVIGYFTPKGRERYSLVLGIINQRGDPFSAFEPLTLIFPIDAMGVDL